jgi:hypothetical protein
VLRSRLMLSIGMARAGVAAGSRSCNQNATMVSTRKTSEAHAAIPAVQTSSTVVKVMVCKMPDNCQTCKSSMLRKLVHARWTTARHGASNVYAENCLDLAGRLYCVDCGRGRERHVSRPAARGTRRSDGAALRDCLVVLPRAVAVTGARPLEPRPLYARRLLLARFDVEGHLYIVAQHRVTALERAVPGEAEVLTVDGG